MSRPQFASRQIGEYLVTALSDGNMAASLDLLLGIDSTAAGDIQRQAGIADVGNIHINGYLIRGKGRTILVDTGTGGLNNAGGLLQQNLVALGVSPEDIDTVLLTHAHPDHIGGLLDAEARPVFTRANVYIHPLEIDHWQDNDKQQRAVERVQRIFALVRRTLNAYKHALHLLDDRELAPGIRPVWLPGHTPGHTGFRIDSLGQSLLIWGDIVHYPHIQTAHPDASIAFDFDPVQAEATRTTLLAQVVAENLLIAGMHFGKQGFAHIFPAGNGYRLAWLEE
jgi:glyoxylase-like metal-dependent hydrolase (beta-lactamase superfamily II)